MKYCLKLSTLSLSLATFLLSASTFAASPEPAAKSTTPKYKGAYKGEMAPPCPELHDGFYVGAAVGYDSYAVKEKESYFAGAEGAGATIIANPVINPRGFNGGFLGGYGVYFQNFYYLAGEIFGNWASAESRWLSTETGADFFAKIFDNEVTVKNNYGVSILPGLKLNHSSLLYLRLGCSWSKIEAETSVEGFGFGAATEEDTTTVRGFNFGIGMEELIADKFSIRGEFNHTKYTEFDSNGAIHVDWQPSDNQYMLALIYHVV